MPLLIDLVQEHPEAEIQTDKAEAKCLPCIGCSAELLVSKLYAPAKAKCRVCKSATGPGVSANIQPGKTDPAVAIDLRAALINPQFANYLCPVNEAHGVMDMKTVSHSPQYGPGHWENGGKVWVNDATGESCIQQCPTCCATISISTQRRTAMTPQNQARLQPDFGPPERNDLFTPPQGMVSL